MDYSNNQARIAKALVREPRTVEELRSELGIPMNELQTDLAKLIKLKLIQKSGFPTKYSIIDDVRRGVMQEESVERPFKAHILVEGQSKGKNALIKAQSDLISQLKSDKLVRAQNIREDEVVEAEGLYSTFFEADVSTKTFEDMVYVILHYGPSSVEFLEPKRFEVGMEEAQGALNDVANTIHSYVGMILQLKLRLDEETINIR
ncbi:MAG: hypothetical protein JW834_00700 [Candidatus Diapherotrites archaeon]|nr:hypothetical protein [Candidatus Diapherotrites archaeon]